MNTTKSNNAIARKPVVPASYESSLTIEGNGRQTRIMTMINREKGTVEIEYHEMSHPFQRM